MDPSMLLQTLGSSNLDPAKLAMQLPQTIMRARTGFNQVRDARRALRELENQRPTIEVPAALRQVAQEPISEQIMDAQAEEQARRTAQSVGALQKAGARGILGGLGKTVDAERASERNRMAGYEQARRGAMSNLGNAQLDVQRRKLADYVQQMNAARGTLEAGQQNIMGILDPVTGGSGGANSSIAGSALSALGGQAGESMVENTTPDSLDDIGDVSGMPSSIPAPNGGQMGPFPQRQSAPQVNAPLPASAGGGQQPSLRTETIGGSMPQDTLNVPQMPLPPLGDVSEETETISAPTRGSAPSVNARRRGLKRTPLSLPNQGLRGVSASDYARMLQIMNRF